MSLGDVYTVAGLLQAGMRSGRSEGTLKFSIGDVVTVHAQLTAQYGLRGTVVEISAGPEDSMPFIVDFGQEWGRHRFGPDELKLADPR